MYYMFQQYEHVFCSYLTGLSKACVEKSVAELGRVSGAVVVDLSKQCTINESKLYNHDITNNFKQKADHYKQIMYRLYIEVNNSTYAHYTTADCLVSCSLTLFCPFRGPAQLSRFPAQ